MVRKSGHTPTIHDVAKEAKVSVMTVSRVLNKPEKVSARTIERIHRIMDGLGYQPSQIARSLVKRKTNAIGIIMPDVKNTFFNSWFSYVEDYARRFGYATLLCSTDENSENEMKFVRTFQAYRVDGILIVPHNEESVRYLMRSRARLVLVDRMYQDIEVDSIVTDHYDGALRLTQYLIELGHRRIAVLRGPGILFPDVERYRGYADAMTASGLEITPSLVRNCEFQEARAFEAVKDLLRQPEKPTAIFSFNSLMTIGTIKAIYSLGMKIPDDVSLVCYDQIPGYEIFEPRITHVLQPIEELGRIATKVLIDKIENPELDGKHNVFLKPQLVIGNSCWRIG